MKRVLKRALVFGFATMMIAVLAPGSSAALKKQCKPSVNVDAEQFVKSFGGPVTPNQINNARRLATHTAHIRWMDLTEAVHGSAYVNWKLARSFKVTCLAKGVPTKSVLCLARGFPCRSANAPAPSRVLNQLPKPGLKRAN